MGRIQPIHVEDIRALDEFSKGPTLQTTGKLIDRSATTARRRVGRIEKALGTRTRKQTIRRVAELGLLEPLGIVLGRLKTLTSSEAITLGLVSRGWESGEIGGVFGLTSGAIDYYVSKANEKLVAGPFSAIRVALNMGVLIPDHYLLGTLPPPLPEIIDDKATSNPLIDRVAS